MHQIKIFKSIETDIAAMEARINAFLKESGAHVVHLTGNIAPQSGGGEYGQSLGKGIAPSDVIVILVYETKA